MSKYNSIFLYGFRATGKSTAGKIVAQKLGWDYLEMDAELEKRAGMTIPELTKNGTNWQKMRQMESDLLSELVSRQNIVVSTGGGVAVNNIIKNATDKTFGEINTKTLQEAKQALSVVLTASTENIIKRIKQDELAKAESVRPILNEAKAKQVQSLLEQYQNNPAKQKEILVEEIVDDSVLMFIQRKPLYAQISPFMVKTDTLSPEQVADEILTIFSHDTSKVLPQTKAKDVETLTPRITAKTKMCVIIGDPVEHSLSPKMHNAAYQALGIDDQFVFTAARTKPEHVKDVVQAVRVMNIRGLTCTVPHKLEVMKYLDWIDPIAQKIGAVNTVVNDDGVLKGYNTDWLGTVIPLEKVTQLQGKKVALIGAGGAARAMAYGVAEKGAILKIYNRTEAKAQELANELGCWAGGLEELKEIKDADIIINSTSIGMGDLVDESPVPEDLIQPNHICFDAVYVPYETKFLQVAKAREATIIHGIDMLLYQGTAQFGYYTGHEAPEKVMQKALHEHFGVN